MINRIGTERAKGIIAAVSFLAFYLLCHAEPAGIPQGEGPSRTLLAVFAHPDDEGMVGPLLARYAREGVDVHLAVVTSGQRGGQSSGIEAGKGLEQIREQEVTCACRRYGIHPPVLLRFQDGAITREDLPRLAAELRKLFQELQPEVVITSGPEGIYGHPDHRTVSNIVTEVFQSREPGKGWPKELYYVGIAAERLQQHPDRLKSPLNIILPVSEKYLSVQIPYTREDLARTEEAFRCHKTQFTEEKVRRNVHALDFLMERQVRLRPWTGSTEIKTDLFHY